MATVAAPSPIRRQLYVPAVGPRLKRLLLAVFLLVALLGANSVYLASISLMEWLTGHVYQNYFYQYMFLLHLVLGLALLLPLVLFGLFHMKAAYNRPNRRAVRVGFALYTTSLLLLGTGVVLMRLGVLEVRDPLMRTAAYWTHVISPLAAGWLYVLHRLAGPRIKWRYGAVWGMVVGAVCLAMVLLHSSDPRRWNQVGSAEGLKYFQPSNARTTTGAFIPARALMMDDYCKKCHADIHDRWYHSAHRFSSFNNPAYLFTVRETRKVALARDGNVRASRFCAGCHDPVPFFSGAFDKPDYDDEHDPTAHAGITCTVCHAMTHVNSNRGNSDFTIEEPMHYPFAYSENPALQFINNQLVKANPSFHKKTFLKPDVHRTAEFCSTCHKVNLPFELTKYREFLRGQNHYDSFLLSGVSGHGIRSFYYPEKAQTNCNGCHMPALASNDFGARFLDGTNLLQVHDHLFPGANTAIPHMKGYPEIVAEHQKFLEGVLRVDVFGIREGNSLDGRLTAPLRPEVPALEPGKTYLLETVIRTLKMGHHFTQGTADSNEVWMDVTVTSGGRVIGRSGGQDENGYTDPWSHFVNVYMLDRHGNRIDRRNAQDIFFPLYNHQIPPGAGQVVHYELVVPRNATEAITIDVKLQYRKFDATYMRYVMGEDYRIDLPITTLASDRVEFPVAGAAAVPVAQESPIPQWQRWNDYGIGLFLVEGEKAGLRQASEAFTQVEDLGRPDGPLNLARVYLREGNLEAARAAVDRAKQSGAPPWTVSWLSGSIHQQYARLDAAIQDFHDALVTRDEQRQFDFSRDYVVRIQLAKALLDRARQFRRAGEDARHQEFLQLAVEQFKMVLEVDSENFAAYDGLATAYAALGDQQQAATYRKYHMTYETDETAESLAVPAARLRDAAANHVAEDNVVYPLQRRGAPGLSDEVVSP
jgi:tetratricopeptide (TPR) repeat protein